MKTGTLYRKLSREVVGLVYCEDDEDLVLSYETFRFGVYEGVFDSSLFYVDSNGLLADRVPLSYTIPASVEINTPIQISGLPEDVFMTVNSVPTAVIEGVLTIVKASAISYHFEAVGKYVNDVPKTCLVIDSVKEAKEADPRWVALQNATPAQIETWINNNITDLASARNLLKTLVLVVRMLHDRTS